MIKLKKIEKFTDLYNYKHKPNIGKKYSNIVSRSDFILYSILSLGFYHLLWMYRNWKFFKEKEKSYFSPFWRTWFGWFFIGELFERILKYSQKAGYRKKYNITLRQIGYILLMIYEYITLDPFTYTFSVVILTMVLFLKPLDAINFYYDKKETNCKPRTWNWRHIIWAIGIALSWYLLYYWFLEI